MAHLRLASSIHLSLYRRRKLYNDLNNIRVRSFILNGAPIPLKSRTPGVTAPLARTACSSTTLGVEDAPPAWCAAQVPWIAAAFGAPRIVPYVGARELTPFFRRLPSIRSGAVRRRDRNQKKEFLQNARITCEIGLKFHLIKMRSAMWKFVWPSRPDVALSKKT